MGLSSIPVKIVGQLLIKMRGAELTVRVRAGTIRAESESFGHFWSVAVRRAAYDPETVSMLSSVLELAIPALPPE